MRGNFLCAVPQSYIIEERGVEIAATTGQVVVDCRTIKTHNIVQCIVTRWLQRVSSQWHCLDNEHCALGLLGFVIRSFH